MVIRRTPGFQFFVQSFTHPSVSVGIARQETSLIPVKYPGDSFDVAELTCTVILDEDMQAYREMDKWVREIKGVGSRSEVLDPDLLKSDLSITMLTNRLNPNYSFVYLGCFPTTLGSITFNRGTSDPQQIVFDVTFSVDYFVIAKE